MRSFRVLCCRCRHFICRVTILNAIAGSVAELELEYKCPRCKTNKAYKFAAADKDAVEKMMP